MPATACSPRPSTTASAITAATFRALEMSDHIETQAEIQEELEELGIDNDSTGAPDVMLSGTLIKVIAALLAALLLAGALLLVF